MNEYLICAIAFIGVAVGALEPYWRKQPNVGAWNHRYTLTALVAVGVVILTVWENVRIFAQTGGSGVIGTFLFGLVLSMGANEITKLGPIDAILKKIGV